MQTSKFDLAYMKMARAMASLSHDPHTQVGCVLVKDNYVISSGYNGTPRHLDDTTKDSNGKTLPTVIHAEMNALVYAARSNISTVGAVAYTTLFPCLKCCIHLYQAGITEIIYSDSTGHTDQCDASK